VRGHGAHARHGMHPPVGTAAHRARFATTGMSFLIARLAK
jgi:hypothetical protein